MVPNCLRQLRGFLIIGFSKPYGRIGDLKNRVDELGQNGGESRVLRNGLDNGSENRNAFKPYRSKNRVDELGENGGQIRALSNGIDNESGNGNGFKGKFRKQRNRIKELVSNGEEPKDGRITNGGVIRRGSNTKSRRLKGSNSEVYDMNLQKDGSYEFQKET